MLKLKINLTYKAALNTLDFATNLGYRAALIKSNERLKTV